MDAVAPQIRQRVDTVAGSADIANERNTAWGLVHFIRGVHDPSKLRRKHVERHDMFQSILVTYLILEYSNVFDCNADHVARLQEFRRTEPDTYSSRRARCNYVTRLKFDSC